MKQTIAISTSVFLAVTMLAASAHAQAPSAAGARTAIQKASFGKTKEGTGVDIYTLTNKNGMTARVMTYGATLTELLVPDKTGTPGNIVLGFDKVEPYLAGVPYFGATVGRVGNRIAKGAFSLNGQTYTLATNNGPNHLHGGIKGFDKVVWKADVVLVKDGQAVKFSYHSPDGEEGYPGNLDVARAALDSRIEGVAAERIKDLQNKIARLESSADLDRKWTAARREAMGEDEWNRTHLRAMDIIFRIEQAERERAL